MRITKTVCDICGKDISRAFHYKFCNWHYRIGKHQSFHMCNSCMNQFIELVKAFGEDEHEKQHKSQKLPARKKNS